MDDYLRTHAAFIKQVNDASVKTTGDQTVAGIKTFSSALGGTSIIPTAALQDDAVTFAKMQNVATATILGRSTAGTGDVEALTGAQVASTMANAIGQLAGMRNKIINGKMEIAQRGTSFGGLNAGSGTTYTLDRFSFFTSAADVQTVSQQADVPNSNEFQSSLRSAVTTATASIAASQRTVLTQCIEGYNVRDLIGRTFTLSFWVRSSKTGTHCIAFRNSGLDRSYIAEYTVSAANTWEQKSVTVSGGLITSGNWNWSNAIGLRVEWVLAAGSNFHTTAGAWQTGNFLATANQVNCLDTIGNIFAITGVQLEVGSVATPFEHRPYGAELALCQRYYQTFGPVFVMFPWASGTQTVRGHVAFAQEMRATPTVTMGSKIAGTGTLAATAATTTGVGFAGTGNLQDVVAYTGSTAAIEL